MVLYSYVIQESYAKSVPRVAVRIQQQGSKRGVDRAAATWRFSSAARKHSPTSLLLTYLSSIKMNRIAIIITHDSNVIESCDDIINLDKTPYRYSYECKTSVVYMGD